MATNLTNDIDSYFQQWTSFGLSITASDFSLSQDVSSFGNNEMPKLQALPGQMKDFVSKQSALINEVKNNHSTSELNEIANNIKSFCEERKPDFKDYMAKLDDLRMKLTGGVSDINGELQKLQSEYTILQKQWNDAMSQCQNSMIDQQECAIAAFGEDNYEKYLVDGFTIHKLTFARDCVSGLTSDVVQLSNVFNKLEDNVNNVLGDIDSGFEDIPEIQDFLSELK